MTINPTAEFLAKFRRGLVEAFNMDELKMLCYDIGINFQNIPGETIEIKALELINHMKRHGKLEQLLLKVLELRPEYDWPILDESRFSETPSEAHMILFLAADPTDQTRLRTGTEFRNIKQVLQLSKTRNFRLELPELSLRTEDITQALIDNEPEIVHFSGHGANYIGLAFEDELGSTQFVEEEALSALFEQFAGSVRCVVLNACSTEPQAKAIARHIDHVIGMNQEIGDRAAMAFSLGFYQALGGGKPVEDAFKLGCVQIRLKGIPEHLTPVLFKKGGASSTCP